VGIPLAFELVKASLFVANFIGTYSLRAFTTLVHVPRLNIFSFLLVSLNGFVNVVAYVVQSRWTFKGNRPSSLQPQVDFSPNVDVQSIDNDQRQHMIESAMSILALEGQDTTDLRVAIERHFQLRDERQERLSFGGTSLPPMRRMGNAESLVSGSAASVDTDIRVHVQGQVVVY